MAISLLHQCGHNSNWNRDSFTDESIGDGLILSPVHSSRSAVEGLDEATRSQSLFDPQYYLPSSQKKKLKTYEFFPETISGGFRTNDFSMHALESASLCTEFQIDQNFRAVIIPTRYFDQMISDFCELQDTYSVHPFIEAISESSNDRPVYLNLVLTSHMIKDSVFRTNILNWVTSFPQIDGLYLIPDCPRTTKQVDDAGFLEELLVMLHQLKEIGLEAILGYQNTEGLLSTVVPDVELTFGTFENTRIFSVDKFIQSDEERRGPKARIYLPGLLNWVQLEQAKEIKLSCPDVWDRVYVPTSYSEAALDAPLEPTFNQPQLYKHHFIVYEQQIRELDDLSSLQRYELLREKLIHAQDCYAELNDKRVHLERHGRGEYLGSWINALDRHWRNYLA